MFGYMIECSWLILKYINSLKVKHKEIKLLYRDPSVRIMNRLHYLVSLVADIFFIFDTRYDF